MAAHRSLAVEPKNRGHTRWQSVLLQACVQDQGRQIAVAPAQAARPEGAWRRIAGRCPGIIAAVRESVEESGARNHLHHTAGGQEKDPVLPRSIGQSECGGGLSEAVALGYGGRHGRCQDRRVSGEAGHSIDARPWPEKDDGTETQEGRPEETPVQEAS